MKDKDIKGILHVKEKKFYYLITGKIVVQNPMEKLEKVLLVRSILDFEPDAGERFKRISLAAAKERNVELVPVYLNQLQKTLTPEVQPEERITWIK